jgi:hypothetical protein
MHMLYASNLRYIKGKNVHPHYTYTGRNKHLGPIRHKNKQRPPLHWCYENTCKIGSFTLNSDNIYVRQSHLALLAQSTLFTCEITSTFKR